MQQPSGERVAIRVFRVRQAAGLIVITARLTVCGGREENR